MLCYTLASPLHKSMHEAKETVPCVKVFVDRRYTTVFYLMPVYRASLVGGRGRPYALILRLRRLILSGSRQPALQLET